MPNTEELPVPGMGDSRARDAGRPRLRVAHSELRSVTVEGRRIAFRDEGDGPAVVLSHCSGGSHREWSTLIPRLAARYRVIAPDLLGYGASEPWPMDTPLPPSADVAVLLSLAGLVEGPIHFVGHSYGGAVALEAARVLGARVASLTLIEPAAFYLLRPAGRIEEWREVVELGDRLAGAVRLRREREAAALFMRYWLGPWRWWLTPAKLRRRIASSMSKVAAEFEAMKQRTLSLGDYRGIYAPTRLIEGDRTRRPARAVVDELLQLLADASVTIVTGAGHMSPVTHAETVNDLVAGHIDACEEIVQRRRAFPSVGTVLSQGYPYSVRRAYRPRP